MISPAKQKVQPLYDVVLSHSRQDEGLASLLRRQFAEAGLGVFGLDEFRPGETWIELLRESLVNSSAVVVLLTRNSVGSPNLAFEFGAALMWSKPVFVVLEGIRPDEVPAYFSECETFRLDQIPELGRRIAALNNPLGDDDRDVLAELYREFSVPTDQLLVNPPVLHELTRRFNRTRSRNLSSERLAQELVRMRKQSRLPKLHK